MMRFAAALALGTALSLVETVAQAGDELASAACERALRSAASSEAVALCSQALDADPDNARALSYRGAAYLALGELERAHEDLGRSAALDGGNPLTFYNLGVYFDKTRHPEKAVDAYSTAIHLSPGNPVAYFNRAKAYERLCRSAEALQDYQKIREIAPGMARVRAIPTSVEGCTAE